MVEAVGEGVGKLRAGDRVAYATRPVGAYSETRVLDASRLVPVSSGITDEEAATLMLKGMTAAYLLLRTHPVRPGETVLVQAAAGGMGVYLLSMGQGPGSHGTGHGLERGQGRDRPRPRLRSRHQLHV